MSNRPRSAGVNPIRFYLLTSLCLVQISVGQGVFVPVTDMVYDYLDKIHVKGLSTYTRLVLPKTQTQIRGYLKAIDTSRSKLTAIEREELDRLKSWYFSESNISVTSLSLPLPSSQEIDKEGFHLFKYRDSLFKLAVFPIVGVDMSYRNDETELRRWNGINAHGSFGENVGAQTDFRDYLETGSLAGANRMFSRMSGIAVLPSQSGTNSIGYNEVKGALTYESPWLNVSIGKEWMNWGSGYSSQLILSQKAPPFPYFRIDFMPVDWFRFYYLHGWLTSRVIDSTRSYSTQVQNVSRLIEREKYYAAHMVELTPFDGLSVSIGESVVYSDQGPLLGFLIPVLFFREVDQNYDAGLQGRGSNSQVFFDLNARIANGLIAYGTWFIDEIDLLKLFSWPNNRNQFGITLGTATQDLLIDDLALRLEYTRILPWVYSNFIQTQTYTNAGYLMGHYIGQNADQLFAQAEYRVGKGIGLKVWVELTRRGGMDSVFYQYQLEAKPFLYGLKREDREFGFEATYEWFLNFVAKLSYEYRDVSDEDPTRTPLYQLGVHHSFGLTLYYFL